MIYVNKNACNATQQVNLPLADLALVVNSDFEKGGDLGWSRRATRKISFVPIYVRSTGDLGKGLEMLKQRRAPVAQPHNARSDVEIRRTCNLLRTTLTFVVTLPTFTPHRRNAF